MREWAASGALSPKGADQPMAHTADWVKYEEEFSHPLVDSSEWAESGDSVSGGLEKGSGPERRGISAAVARLMKKMGSVERV